MIKEYFLTEDKDKWLNFVFFHDVDEVEDYTNFHDANLLT